jgi:ribosomal protein S13
MNMTTERQGSRIMRTDVRTCDLINQAIASIPSVGLQRAAEFLASMNVPAEIAIRTLVYPARRRAYN